jgi:hypothetical protein
MRAVVRGPDEAATLRRFVFCEPSGQEDAGSSAFAARFIGEALPELGALELGDG